MYFAERMTLTVAPALLQHLYPWFDTFEANLAKVRCGYPDVCPLFGSNQPFPASDDAQRQAQQCVCQKPA